MAKCEDDCVNDICRGPLYTVTVTVTEPHTNVIARIDIELTRDDALELLEQCNDAFQVAGDIE